MVSANQIHQHRARRACLTTLRVEVLEDRRLLATVALDPSFSGDGIATDPIAPPDERVAAIVLQPIKNNLGQIVDEKILVGGHVRATNNSYDFHLARYNSDGSPDTSFGTNGVAVTDFAGGTDSVNHLLITSQGKIIAVGQAYSSGGLTDVGIAQYTANGVLDKTYGAKGKVTVQFMGGYAEIRDYANAAVLDNDRLVIAGQTNGRNFDGFHYSNYVARFTSSGALDRTFGKGGKVVGPTNLGSGDQWGALTVRGGEIIVVGQDNRLPTVARLDERGTIIKATMAEGPGKVVFSPGGQTFVGLQTIEGAGTSNDIHLARFNVSDGQLDPTFGTAGRTVTDFSTSEVTSNEIARDLTFDAQGRILVAGQMRKVGSTDSDQLLIRYDASGLLDTGFGTGGAVVTPEGPDDFSDTADRVLVQNDARILIFGSSTNRLVPGDTSMTLTRYVVSEEALATPTTASTETSAYDAALAALLAEEEEPLGRRRK